jgi:hypothetical protein
MLKLRHSGQINTYLRLQTLQYIDTAVRNFCFGLALPYASLLLLDPYKKHPSPKPNNYRGQILWVCAFIECNYSKLQASIKIADCWLRQQTA